MNFSRDPRFDKVRRFGAAFEEWCTPVPWIKKLLRLFSLVVPAPVKAFWSFRLSHGLRHVLVNVSIGLGISLALNVFHLAPWLHEKEECALDWIMVMNAGTRLGLNPSSRQPEQLYAFVDVDEWTYRAWGEPFFTPRDKLAALITAVTAAKPRLTIVDVELDRPNRDAPAQDARLIETLAGLSDGPPVILVKSLRQGLRPGALLEMRRSFLDQIVASSKRLHWAAPTFLRDDSQIIRRWKIAVCVDTPKGPVVLPSVQLLAYALLSPGPAGNQLEELATQLEKARGICSKTSSETPGFLILGGQSFALNETGLEHRIMYSMKQGGAPQKVLVGQEERPLFVSVPAQSILSGGATILTDMLRDRVVIIGGSFAESFDMYKTPLGVMPGAVIILNSLRSLFTYGVDHQPSWVIITLIEVVLIAVMTFFFMWFNSFWGMLLSGGVIIVLLLPASILAFRYGVWLDFAIPLAAVQIHRLIEEFKKRHIDHNNIGWR